MLHSSVFSYQNHLKLIFQTNICSTNTKQVPSINPHSSYLELTLPLSSLKYQYLASYYLPNRNMWGCISWKKCLVFTTRGLPWYGDVTFKSPNFWNWAKNNIEGLWTLCVWNQHSFNLETVRVQKDVLVKFSKFQPQKTPLKDDVNSSSHELHELHSVQII